MFFDSSSNYNVSNVGLFSWKNTVINKYDIPRIKHGFSLITEGCFIITTEKETIKAVKGDLLFLPFNSRYKTEIAQAKSYILNFSNDSVTYNSPIILLSNVFEKYEKRFEQLVNLQKEGESEFLIKSAFYKLLDHIVKDMDGIKDEKDFIKKARTLLNSEKEYTISEIARECAVSDSGLRRQFKETYGVSPMEYKTKIKIERAKYLLDSSSMSITQIAEILGFFDAAYFSKIFKKHTGYSPSQYSKNKTL